MKPRKPTKPKGISANNAGRRGRSVGTSMQYTPEQTRRYKSQAIRYSKAVELAVGGPDFVQTKDGSQLSSDVVKGKGRDVFEISDRLLFRYSSDRAPRDYWTVIGEATGEGEGGEERTYSLSAQDITTSDQSYTITVNDVLIDTIPRATVPNRNYMITTLNGGLVIEFASTADTTGRTDVAVVLTAMTPEVKPMHIEVEATVQSNVEAVGGDPDTLVSQIVAFEVVGEGSADIYTPVFPPFPSGSNIFQNFFNSDDVSRVFGASPRPDVDINFVGTPVLNFFVFSFDNSTQYTFKTIYRINAPEREIGFRCDCPDFTKTIATLPRSQFNSERVDREWVASNAGCDQEQGCKHIIATKLHLGLPVSSPTDIPL